MSGRQRIPSLRIEFTDHRPAGGTWVASSPDAGASRCADPDRRAGYRHRVGAGQRGEGSCVGSGERSTSLRCGGAVAFRCRPGGGSADRLALWLLRRLRVRAAQQVRESAFDRARSRMSGLERRGWPSGSDTDGWYVELSDIVRRYIEDRFGVRAPELTTEEFSARPRPGCGLGQSARSPSRVSIDPRSRQVRRLSSRRSGIAGGLRRRRPLSRRNAAARSDGQGGAA